MLKRFRVVWLIEPVQNQPNQKIHTEAAEGGVQPVENFPHAIHTSVAKSLPFSVNFHS